MKQQQIDILTDLINKSGLKPTQKKLSFDIIADFVTQFNILEGKYQQRMKFDLKLKTDFIDWADRMYTIANIMQISEVDLLKFKFKYLDWLTKFPPAKTATFFSLQQLSVYLEMFESCYNRLPNDVKELKNFVLDPLEVKEENFEAAVKQAFIDFYKDKFNVKAKEIIQLAWIKDVFGIVKYK